MGKFSALPRGSIKSLFYSVNPFSVQSRAYRRGSHAAWEGAAEMKHSRQKGLTALCSLPGQRPRGGGALGIPATMPHQADFPLGCRHNNREIPGMLNKLPGTQDVPGKEQREIPDFFSLTEKEREERILQDSYYRQKGTKT